MTKRRKRRNRFCSTFPLDATRRSVVLLRLLDLIAWAVEELRRTLNRQ